MDLALAPIINIHETGSPWQEATRAYKTSSWQGLIVLSQSTGMKPTKKCKDQVLNVQQQDESSDFNAAEGR